eukprot:scaffold71282_cov75-Phaeocystis_antarctica.AAC.1
MHERPVSRCRVWSTVLLAIYYGRATQAGEAKRYIVRTNEAHRGSLRDGKPVQGSGEETELRLNG